MSTFRVGEIGRFERNAATWWHSNGPMRPLQVFNARWLGHVLEQIARRFERSARALQSQRLADIGCGAGSMCELLAQRAPTVVGINAAAKKNFAALRLHAPAGGWRNCFLIDFRVGEPRAAPRVSESFDVLLEVVELVADLQAFLRDAVTHLAHGGRLLVSTIHRTLRSHLAVIVGAEMVFRILPRSTHR